MMDSSMPTTQPAIEHMDDRSNLFMGLIGGVIAMLVGAILWGSMTYFTEYQIGWVAIGVGFLVGIAIKYFGRGKTAIFGISGAFLSLMGCVLGNLLVYSGIIAHEENTTLLNQFFSLLLNPAAAIELFILTFEFMDLFFYAIAAYVGFSAAMDVKRVGKSQASPR
jgi:hypothetical protein